MSMMLASVRDVSEAALAIEHGADWIDVKDPRRGALGAPRAAAVTAIVRYVGGRLPVSATIGDCWNEPGVVEDRVARAAATGVDYVKVGLNLRAPTTQVPVVERCAARGHRLIVVCMAEAPPRDNAVRDIAAAGAVGIMLDTADKSGLRLTALLDFERIAAFVHLGRELGLLTGLAGRLRASDVATLIPAGADYLGFRSALCERGRRESTLSGRALARVHAVMHAGIITSGTQDHNEVA